MDVTKFPLPAKMKQQLDVIREKRAFNPEEWIDKKCKMLNKYFSDCGLKGIVISCSGGIDSSVTAALCVRAQKMEGSPIKKIIPLAQPIHSTVSIQDRAFILCKHLGLEIKTIDQTKIFDQLSELITSSVGMKGNDFANGQLRSYMRTPAAYYTAQLLSAAGYPAVVMGTGNFDEDGYILYYCKAGDGVVDLSLISDLHKSEVYRVGIALQLPDIVVNAVPSADLWEGQTDEDELGFSYQFVELYTEYLMMSDEEQRKLMDALDEDSKRQFEVWAALAQKVHKRNSHKRYLPKTLPVYPQMDAFLSK